MTFFAKSQSNFIMELIPEWAPNLHPMVIHFPIAIISLAVLMDLLNLLLPKDQTWWNEKSTFVLYILGTVMTVGVYFTGRSAADSVFLPTEAQNLLNAHADWALWTVWFLVIYTAARAMFFWKDKIHRRSVSHIIFFVTSLVSMILFYQTSDRGAEMVFRHGVGVQVEESSDTNEAEGNTDKEPEAAFAVHENGDWSWDVTQGATQVLQDKFLFVEGDTDQLNAQRIQVDGGTEVLQFYGNDLDVFFVTQESYQNVQADYYLDLSNFKGTVTLVNHAQDENNYDYVSISSDGSVVQGRENEGETEIFEKGDTEVTGSLFVRVVANGTHFRGYVDEEMIVHGHGDAPEAGQVGLKLEGSGILQLEKVEMVQLENE